MSNEVQKNLSEISKEGITPAELTEAKTAINLLKNQETEQNKKALEKSTEAYKTDITNGIESYFTKKEVKKVTPENIGETIVKEDKPEIDMQNIAKLNLEQTTAYIHLIDRANPNGLPEIKKELTNRQTALQQEADAKAITEAGNKSLNNFLTATPSKELADKLFGGQGDVYKGAWEAVFKEQRTIKNVKKSLSPNGPFTYEEEISKLGVEDQKMLQIIALGSNKKIEQIKEIHIQIADKNDITYPEGTKYIKVIFQETTNEKNETIPAPETQDIMFGASTDVLHTARAQKFTAENFDTKNLNVASLDKVGAHKAFEKLLNTGKLAPDMFLNKKFFEQVNNVADPDKVKENGYYDTITDYVSTQTLAHPNDLTLLQSYLKIVDREHVNYLGTDRSHQVANYNKLAKPEIVKLLADQAKAGNVLAQEIQGNILGLQDQLKTDAKGRKEALNGGVDGFFKAFGKQMTGILERFGGKGAVKKFFHSLGMDDFYTKNLKNIDDNINRIYKEKYELNTDQKDAISKIAKDDIFENKLLDKNTKFSKHLDNFNKNKGGDISKKLSENFQYMDPTLIASLISNSSLDSKANGEKLTASDYIIKEGKEFKINSKILSNESAKTYIINRMLSDPSTRKTIEAANQKIDGAITSGETSKTIEFSRSDLGEKGADTRRQFTIQTEQDIATYVAAYAFAGSKSIDYVITESDLKHPIIEEPKAPVAEAKTETKAETKAETKPNTKKPAETKEKATPTVAQTQEKKAKDI